MGKFSEIAKKFDMYASLPRLSFGKDGKVYSHLGLLLTLLTVIIIGGMAIWIGINVFGRHKPSFVQYDLPPKEFNPKIPFNTDDFKFGISLLIPEEDRYVSRMIMYYNMVDVKGFPLTERKCQFNEIAPGEDFTCFDQAEETKGETYLDVKGNWKYFMMYSYCVDPNKDCYPLPDTKAFLELSGYATLMFEDLLIDPFNYENPVTTTTGFANQAVYLSVGTTLVIELNEVEFISDNGWLFEDKKTVTRFKPTVTKEVSNTEMLSLQLKYGGTKTVYKRSYPKIQDFLAQVGGIITIITPIFFILISPYIGVRAVQQMVNEIYEIKLNKSDKGDSPQKSLAKKKRRSSKYIPIHSKTASPTSARETEGELLTQKERTVSKIRASVPHAAHTSLVIQLLGQHQPAEEISPIPKENSVPLQPLQTLEKSPSSPFKSSSSRLLPQEDEQTNLVVPKNPTQDPPEDLEGQKEMQNPPVEEHNPDKEEASESEEEEEEEVTLRTSDKLEVPWQTWLKSFFKPNAQVQVLNKAKEHLSETFDLLTLSKKVMEIDKLKACLLTHDQRVLFENLPSSVIVLNPEIDLKSPEAIQQYHWKESFKGDEVALRKTYSNLQGTKNQLDQRLMRLYESEYLEDGDAMVRQED